MLSFDDIVALQLAGGISKADVEEALYAMAAGELSADQYSSGLRAKAFSEADGDEKKAAALYLKWRVKQLSVALDGAVKEAAQEAKRQQSAAERQQWAAERERQAKAERDYAASASKKMEGKWPMFVIAFVMVFLALFLLLWGAGESMQ